MSREEREARRQERKNTFLAAFAETQSVKLAAEISGIPGVTHYSWVRNDPDYESRYLSLGGVDTSSRRGYKKDLDSSQYIERQKTQLRMLNALGETGLVGEACQQAGVPYTTHFMWLKCDEEYKKNVSFIAEKIAEARRESCVRGALIALSKRKMTRHETAIASALELCGIAYVPHDIHTGYEMDLYVPSVKLDIEVDGHMHVSVPNYQQLDADRDLHLKHLGYRVHRITPREIDTGDYVKPLKKALNRELTTAPLSPASPPPSA